MDTPHPDFTTLVQRQRVFFQSGATLSTAFRLEALKSFKAALQCREDAILEALGSDLGKHPVEAYLTELGVVLSELDHTTKRLKQWIKPRRVPSALPLFPAVSRIHPEPLGVTLILSPWNYPFQLAMVPLVAALAAGNCVVLKPSGQTPATAACLNGILTDCFDPEHVLCVLAGHEETDTLLKERFDFIFYTGSARVGKKIMAAAARNLTPVCLELGGKSPAIVARDADLRLAARRIAWGKLLNAGQTCIAPDYILADNRIIDSLLAALEEAFEKMLGQDPLRNPDYGRIIHKKAFARLHYLSPAPPRSNEELLKIVPHVFKAGADHPAMREEIFGPLLPLLGFDEPSEAADFVKNRDKPLALYLFTNDRDVEQLFMRTVPFGGGCLNDTILHVSSPHLPFGGVGASGMGRYHGQSGFETFSNRKSVVHKSRWLDPPFRYPPYKEALLPWLKRFFGGLFLAFLLFTGPSAAAALDYGAKGLQVQPVAGFVDSESIAPCLFERTRAESGLDGVLLKIYLPDNIAQLFADGRSDAVTRQLCLYGIKDSQTYTFDKRTLELMAKTLEGAYEGYTVLPVEIRRNRQAARTAMQEAVQNRTPMLVHNFSTDNTISYLTLLPFSMGDEVITQAICTSLILVGDSIVLATANSIIQDAEIYEHTLWVRSAVESAADMLLSANK